jgi:hypothetical protein
MTDTVEKGNQLRDDIAALLRCAHYHNVEVEKRVGSKKIDIYFEERSLGTIRRIGVECKNYDAPLTKGYISSKIYPDYNPLIDSNQLDGVLIISIHPLNADAKKYVDDDVRFFSYMTFTELQNELMDFSLYLRGIKAQYYEEGLATSPLSE